MRRDSASGGGHRCSAHVVGGALVVAAVRGAFIGLLATLPPAESDG